MAKRQFSITNESCKWDGYLENLNEQINEIQALQSFYEATGNLTILEEGSAEKNTFYSIQICVHVNVGFNPINLELWLPFEDTQGLDLTENHDFSIPVLQRSISGRQAHTTINCDYLPPLMLNILLSPFYPSIAYPDFTIRCSWLNTIQIEELCSALDDIWQSNQTFPVIYTFVDWLQNNTLQTLNILYLPNKIVISPCIQNEETKRKNPNKSKSRAISEYKGIHNCIFNIIKFNMAQKSTIFRNSSQECPICFQEKMGIDCIKLDNCKHYFCIECLTDYCKMHVSEGTINKLKCPDCECTEPLSNDVMQILLSKEEYSRWKRLAEQRALDIRDDIMYCPKCSKPIEFDNASTHTYCKSCAKDFCRSCKESWHVGKCKTLEEIFDERLKNMNLNVKELLEMNETTIKFYFKNNDFVIKMLDKLKSAMENKDILKSLFRCPDCHMAIEKNDGCNKITCVCGAYMCYLCGNKINGYDHFENGECELWAGDNDHDDEEEDTDDDEHDLNYQPYVDPVYVTCPICGNRGRKLGTNNHLKCRICGTNFCCICKNRITGVITAHFKNTGCKQHTQD